MAREVIIFKIIISKKFYDLQDTKAINLLTLKVLLNDIDNGSAQVLPLALWAIPLPEWGC